MNALNKIGIVFSLVLASGCAGVATSGLTYDDQYKLNVPKKTDGCYDASVLLGANIERTKDVSRKVITAVDATVEKETADSISAQRNRHIGLLVGSGGEELLVNWKSITPEKTFVTVATKTGFVGGAGQKAWSCQVVDEMVKMVAK
ncbi:MAG TPA: hypothetical protein VF928_06280 [Usitatibacteraceae bacterium]